MWYIIIYLHYSLPRDIKEFIYRSMSFVCLLIGLITYWRRKKKTFLELLCMLCNLCFVSVKGKRWETGESAAGVCREMAPGEIVLEDYSLVWHCKKKKRYGSQAMITSGPVLRPPLPPPPLLHATNTHILMHTCWPVLLRRREMLSNSAFQHSTSDYLFSFTGRFELVMYFPFGVGLASLSRTFSLTHTGNSSFPSGRRSRNLRGQAFFFLFPPYE